jgi:formylglycine-generating enzyme required for sulfatase activity
MLKRTILILAGAGLTIIFSYMLEYTSRDEFCDLCHAHPQAASSWKFSTHFDNRQGIKVHCVECHLPPGGTAYLSAKLNTGIRDVVAMLFKDISAIDWEQRSTRTAAAEHVYKSGCLYCHQNLFPRGMSRKGEEAHLYYDQRPDDLRCINCHLHVGHFHQGSAEQDTLILETVHDTVYNRPAVVDSFVSFTETIPGTAVSFEMIAIPAGEFIMGSPEDEAYRSTDEGPQHQIRLTAFWMGKHEVSWDEYLAFYHEHDLQVDAITGPTPPYGNPDQGWGRGKMPAITMTHFAAETYCRWLSQKTGRIYRLPTEAEWEYACRSGSEGAYFFPGKPEDYSARPFFNNFFGPDTAIINTYVKYAENSSGRTHLPGSVLPNGFGLVHMLGNVKEFCSDVYRQDAYGLTGSDADRVPEGSSQKSAIYVIRGGSFSSDAAELRAADRDFTRPAAWLLTDPQQPKSIWWYSDCNDVGFRVVCG